MEQGVLALVRSTDPHSSTVGAARARTTSQKAMILRTLLKWEEAWGDQVVVTDADRLHELWPGIQRSVLSTRLSAMAKAGLLRQNRETVPVTYTLTELGRTEARRLSR